MAPGGTAVRYSRPASANSIALGRHPRTMRSRKTSSSTRQAPSRRRARRARKNAGIERLAVLAGEVLLGRPVEVLEIRRLRAPLEVMAQLVGEGLPRFLPPVEPGVRCASAAKDPW